MTDQPSTDHSSADLDALLDRAIEATRVDTPSDTAVAAAGERAWAQVSAALGRDAAAIGAAGETDYRALIPDYLAGRLSPAQAMLVADHVREDPVFRAEVEAARTGAAPRRLTVVAPAAAPAAASRAAAPWYRRRAAWPLAAAAVMVLALGTFLFARDLIQPNRVLAQVAEVDGGLALVSNAAGGRALAVGDAIRPRQQLRAARDGGAVVTLTDGSTIELGPRAELALASRWNGMAIDLARGDIIVHAADQGRGRLHVATDDLDAAVHGTIFAVRHGTKGSRVSVVEGEVEVAGAQGRRTLAAGMQYASRPAVGAVPIAQEVAWSRHSAEYLHILAELEKLGQAVDASVEHDRPAPRRTSTLVGAVPADTVVFVALPNLGHTVAQSYTRFQAGVAENPVLRDWWAESMDDPEAQAFLDQLVAAMAELSAKIGDEIVITVGVDESGEPTEPVLMARVDDPTAFRDLLEGKLAEIKARITEATDGTEDTVTAGAVRIVADRAELEALVAGEGSDGATGEAPIVVWIGDGLVMASPSAAVMRASLEGPRGLPAEFAAAIAAGYAGGVDALLAIDVRRLTTAARAAASEAARGGGHQPSAKEDGEVDEGLAFYGLDEARYAIATQVTEDGRSRVEASLSFEGARKGIAGLLAAPGPMGALDFVSPGAYVAGAALIDRPERIVAEFLGLARAAEPEMERDPDAVLGTELLEGLARPLGGEVAFAIDGPVLPKPAWKMVVEVSDPAALQAAIEHTVEQLNTRLDVRKEAPSPRRLGLTPGELDGRPMWTLVVEGDVDLPAMHWLYTDGYLVAASDPGLLSAALRTRASGVTLRNSETFVAALPAGAETDFSAVAWQDVGRLTRAVADAMPEPGDNPVDGAGPEGGPDLDVMRDFAARLTPSLAYAWAEPDRLRFAASSEASPFGMAFLFKLLGTVGAEEGRGLPGPGMDGVPMPFDGSAAWEPGA